MERKSKKEGIYVYIWDSLVARLVTNLLAMQETQVQFLDWEGPPCWRKWQPTPVFLPGKSHGQRSLVVYSPWGRKELDTTEQLSTQHMYIYKTDALCCTVETTQNCKATMYSVTQSCPVLCNLMDCSPLPRQILEWVAISFSRGSSWCRDWTQVSCIAGRFLTIWITRAAQLYSNKKNFF